MAGMHCGTERSLETLHDAGTLAFIPDRVLFPEVVTELQNHRGRRTPCQVAMRVLFLMFKIVGSPERLDALSGRHD